MASRPIIPHNELGHIPIFRAMSSETVLLYLESGLRDLGVVNEQYDGLPLLHSCVNKGIANEEIVRHLKDQVDVQWKGLTAIDWGKYL